MVSLYISLDRKYYFPHDVVSGRLVLQTKVPADTAKAFHKAQIRDRHPNQKTGWPYEPAGSRFPPENQARTEGRRRAESDNICLISANSSSGT